MKKICPTCNLEFDKATKYCSQNCYSKAPRSEETRRKMSAASLGKPKSDHMREALSRATKGKPKPHMAGKSNPNFGGKYSSDPEIHSRFLEAVKERGQAWGEEQRKAHSQRMLGDSNAMRGKQHSEEFRLQMSELKSQQYREGKIKANLNKISKAEKEIAEYLINNGVEFKKQYHISGVPYWYDFYLPHKNLIIEYQGDYWHANPEKFQSGMMINIISKGPVMVDSIWKRDALKRKAAEDAGYKFVAIWEAEYKLLGFEALKKYL